MKTYAESKNRTVTNWPEELNKAAPDWQRLQKLAADWPTCACGNQCDIIPRSSEGAPTDTILRVLGGRFFNAAFAEDADLALEIWYKIETRAEQIIKEINNPKN
jgi:hypothetical protein